VPDQDPISLDEVHRLAVGTLQRYLDAFAVAARRATT